MARRKASRGTPISRPRYRACLQDGLKLDLNHLARKGFIKFGANIGARGISWSSSHQGEIAKGVISADMTNPDHAWFRLALGSFTQQITLVSRPRHFGGCQFFFVCPVTGGLASVLWKPPGAARFCSRQAWGRRVAYASQFLDRDGRAHHGQSKINSRLCSIGKFDADEWSFPPKPKGMRWKTYNRLEQKFDRYEDILDSGIERLVAKLGGL
jgi:hypothetical protein